MTAIEKYIEDHPYDNDVISGKELPFDCPNVYGYLDGPSWCTLDFRDCKRCWMRKIPENKEKENEKMSDDLIEKAYDEKYKNTSASSHMHDIPERTDKKIPVNDLDYKAEYERLKELVHQKDVTLLESMNRHEVDQTFIHTLQSEIEKYKFGFHVVEALMGCNILEGF